MFGKRLRFLTMLGVAVGIPYAWFSDTVGKSVQNGWKSWKQLSGSPASRDLGDTTWPIAFQTSSAEVGPRDPSAPAVGASLHELSDVLRFDVTPRWVTDRWSRISTVRAERDLVGLRVPLVTGTEVADLAGSLTYFFDATQRLRRLTLHGQTGDDRAVVSYVMQNFGMQPEPHLGGGIYLLRWNAKPMNVLRVSHAPVIRADEPHARLVIELELNDVHGGYGVSSEFASLLVPDQHVRRW
jgi:hypothetical protein